MSAAASARKGRKLALPVAAPAPASAPAPWYAAGLRFACTQCGNCCTGSPGYVWLTTADMERIAAFLHLEFDQFTRTYVRRIGNRYSLLEKFNYDCTFLKREDGQSMCMIYPVRPTQCRTWPFWDDNLKTPAHWQHASARCPGMCAADGPKHGLAHIEKRRTDPGTPQE